MIKRKLLIALAAAVLYGVLAVASAAPAGAEQRTLLVTLVGGSQRTIVVDVPADTPVDAIPLPDIDPATVASVVDVTPPATTTATTTPTTSTTTTTVAPTTTTTPPTTTGTPTTKTHPTAPTTTDTTGTTPARTTTTGADRPQIARGHRGTPKQHAQPTTGTDTKARPKHERSTAGGSTTHAHRRSHRRTGTTGTQAPTPASPGFTVAEPAPAPIGVPNFFIEQFRVPPFLLPIYQAAGTEYGVPWEVLAAINEIETDYGRNLNVSSAGAVGWMQFMPATWAQYGVDANGDGQKDPYNPVDAIFAAARYLRAAGAESDLNRAIFAYNHAQWYVDSVLLRARLLGGLPADFVGSLTGLTEGRFPVAAKSTYADALHPSAARRRVASGDNAAVPVDSLPHRRSIDIFSKPGTPVIAVQDGRIVARGSTPALGRFIRLRDAYGNTYTYSHLGTLSSLRPVPKPKSVSQAHVLRELALPKADPKPTAAASAGRQAPRTATPEAGTASPRSASPRTASPRAAAPAPTKERLFANPTRPRAYRAGGRAQLQSDRTTAAGTSLSRYFAGVYGLNRNDVELKPLRAGSKVIAGTILGRIGEHGSQAPHVRFQIRPAGKGAPLIDPKPILDGWQLLQSTAIYRAAGRSPFFGPDAKDATVGQVLLMSKAQLERRVLSDPNVDIYACGRRDIASGQIDRRVLATLEFLSASGLDPTVSALKCGHSYLTTSGNVSEHSTGDAVDIAAINGIPILGHQGPGSITDITIRRLLTLQGAMKPHQIISLMSFPQADNTLALPDHYNHIHVGFHPLLSARQARHFDSVLLPGQWTQLIARLNELPNPTVPLKPSKYALKVPAPGSPGSD